jgi:high frequency lysogenization protein
MVDTVNNNKWHNTTIDLAGVFQVATLVDKLATTGYFPIPQLHTAVTCLLNQNPASVEDTFGDVAKLTMGFELLVAILTSIKKESSKNSVRYVLSMMYLQKKLRRHKDMLAVIGSRLQQVKNQADHFEPTHENVIANLADLYTDTISKFRYRIHVKGDPTYLQQQRIASQIRTLLFAGIRAAILWHQIGGRRWQILAYRNDILAHAQRLLAEARRH